MAFLFSVWVSNSCNSYNYGCDEIGRTVFRNHLNGAAIDLADGVFNFGLQMSGNANVSWDFSSDLPSVSEVLIISQSGVTFYDRLYGQSTPVTSLLVPPSSSVTFIVKFNQSMLEETQDAIQGIAVNTAMPIVQYGSTAITVQAASGTGWSRTTYTDDTWTGAGTIPATFSGPQTLSIQSFLTGQTNSVENQLERDESTANGYNPGPDKISVFQVGNPSYVQSVTLSQGPQFNMFYVASWPTTAQGAPPSGPLSVPI